MIERVVVLVDQSAEYTLGGLTQVDRLLRTLEECFAPSLGTGGDRGPEVIVLKHSSAPWEGVETRLPMSYRSANATIAADVAGETMVVRTSVLFRRGALARLLQSGERHPAFAVLGPEQFPARRERLDQAVGRPSGWTGDESVWVLDSAADIPEVERRLFRSLGKPTDGLVSRLFNRPISRRVSRLLSQTRVTPNQISFLVLSVLAASTWMLALGTPKGFVIGMLLFHLASVLDGCDGEIARAKFLETRLGGRLDTAVDLLGNHLLALAVGVGLWRQPGLAPGVASAYLLEGVLTAVGIALGVWGIARYTRPTSGADHFNEFGSSMVSGSGIPAIFRPLAAGAIQVLRRDTYALIFVILAVLGRPEWILHCLAIGVALHFPVIAWSLWKLAKLPAPVKARDGSP